MLLGGGTRDDVRLLAPLTVARMTRVSTPPHLADRRGLGWDIDSRYSSNRGDLFPVGSYGHTGFTGTSLWIDPASETFVVFLSSRVHPSGGGNVTALRGQVATVVASALRGDSPATPRGPVWTGVDVLREEGFRRLSGRRVGLLTNRTGRARDGASTIDLLAEAPDVELAALFSPEHGIRGELDGPVPSGRDVRTGLPVHSLYGETRRPTEAMLRGLDTVVVDLQDAGARFYTYATTVAYLLEAAARHGLRVVVLDRPNPIGGREVEGPRLDRESLGFTGYFPTPVRHGLTLGELARLFNGEREIGADLEVVPMRGWTRDHWFDETGVTWVDPSPNLRNLHQALLYPGIGAIEGANLSVGRGTDTPFEQIGAPWIDGPALARELNRAGLPGLRVYPVSFTPDEQPVRRGALPRGVLPRHRPRRPAAGAPRPRGGGGPPPAARRRVRARRSDRGCSGRGRRWPASAPATPPGRSRPAGTTAPPRGGVFPPPTCSTNDGRGPGCTDARPGERGPRLRRPPDGPSRSPRGSSAPSPGSRRDEVNRERRKTSAGGAGRRRAAGAAIAGMLLLAAAGAVRTEVPAVAAAVPAWIALALLWRGLGRQQHVQALAFIAAGAAAMLWAASRGAAPDIERVLSQNQPILSMLAAVTALRLLNPPPRPDEPELPRGLGAYLRSMLGVHAFGAVINVSAVVIMADRLARVRPLEPNQAQLLSRSFSAVAFHSPFIGGVALALAYTPGSNPLVLMAYGVPLALAAFLLLAWYAYSGRCEDIENFRGYPVHPEDLRVPVALGAAVLGRRRPDVRLFRAVVDHGAHAARGGRGAAPARRRTEVARRAGRLRRHPRPADGERARAVPRRRGDGGRPDGGLGGGRRLDVPSTVWTPSTRACWCSPAS